MARTIHPTAVVSPKANLPDDIEVGPHVVIDEHVVLGEQCVVHTGSILTGHTTIGARNEIGPYASLGTPPQDIGYDGEPTRLLIGDDNIIREFCTMNRASTKHEGETRVGSRNYIMEYCHIAHDCEVGDEVVMANWVGVSGHCKIEDKVWFGGMVGMHQFVTIGTHAFIGGQTGIRTDCPPYMVSEGRPARVIAVNTIGLKRRDFSKDAIAALRKAQRLIWRSHLTVSQAVEQLAEDYDNLTDEVRYLVDYLRATHAGRQGRAREVLRK
ncbi:MAG: acyl-ACP--UDP-N-acetylglucosamine O-acyltransferase [Planctomycetota bacterium]